MFKKALLSAVALLEEQKIKNHIEDFAIIGGIALARVAQPRATLDIDFVIKLKKLNLNELALELEATARKGSISDPLEGTISFSIKEKSVNIPIQLIQFPKTWEKIALQGIQITKFDKKEIPFASWKALLLLKLYAGSFQDLEDAKSILKENKHSKIELKELLKAASNLRVSKRLKRVLEEL